MVRRHTNILRRAILTVRFGVLVFLAVSSVAIFLTYLAIWLTPFTKVVLLLGKEKGRCEMELPSGFPTKGIVFRHQLSSFTEVSLLMCHGGEIGHLGETFYTGPVVVYLSYGFRENPGTSTKAKY